MHHHFHCVASITFCFCDVTPIGFQLEIEPEGHEAHFFVLNKRL